MLRLPLALLFAAVAAAVTYVVAPGHPVSRAGAYAAGALIACYALGPGSERSRRPLSKFFGAVTSTTPSAIVAFVGMTALAVGMLAAAFSLPAFFWPAGHVALHVHHLPGGSGLLAQARHALAQLARRMGI